MRLYSTLTAGLVAAALLAVGQPAAGQYSPYPGAVQPTYNPAAYAPQMTAQQQQLAQQQIAQQRALQQQAMPQQAVPQQPQATQQVARPAYAPAVGYQPMQGQPYAQAPVAVHPSATAYQYGQQAMAAQLGLTQQPMGATQQPAAAAPRVAYMQSQGSDSRQLPAPTEAIEQAPATTASPVAPTVMPAVTPGPMSTVPMTTGPMTATPATSYGVATHGAAPAGDCGCNTGAATGTWEGYLPAATGCTTGDCGYAGAECGDFSCAPYCDTRPKRQWFAGLYGLYMGRDNPGKATSAFLVDPVPTGTYYPQPGTDVFFLTSEADVDFTGGGEVRLGSTFGCASDPCSCTSYQPFAWEIGYWGLAEDSSFGELADDDFAGTDRIYGAINYAGLEYDRDGAGTTYSYRPLNDYYDYQAPIDPASTNDLRVLAVRVRQTFQVQNIELNFWRFGSPGVGAGGCGASGGGLGIGGGALRNTLARGAAACGVGSGAGCNNGCYGGCNTGACSYDACGCAPAPRKRFFINGLAGVRYFRLDETFRNSVFFAAPGDPGYPGDMPPTDQVIFHDVEVDNDLVGFQLGSSMNCLVGCKWTLFCDTNFGIYGNQIDSY
ncbi:MAG: hypothetical protein AAGF31_04705 [Planctomycetota bacterium]